MLAPVIDLPARSSTNLLSSSEVEPYSLTELLSLADADSSALWERMTLGYSSHHGHELLRAEIAALYPTAAAQEVLVCAGADQAVVAVVGSLVCPGDRVVLVEPVYGPLLGAARAVGADIRFVPLHASENWRFDLDRLDEALGPRPRLAIFNFPHNPTGCLPPHDVFAAAVRLVEERGGRVISDEVYRGLEYDLRDRLPSVVDISESAVAVGVMSKAYAAPGLRIGWLASHDRSLLERAARTRDLGGALTAAPSEVLALIALRARDEVLARSCRIVACNLDVVADFLRRRSDVLDWVPPLAGTVCYPWVSSPAAVESLATELGQPGPDELLTGAFFGGAANHFRIGLGRLDLPTALEALDQALP